MVVYFDSPYMCQTAGYSNFIRQVTVQTIPGVIITDKE